MGFLGNLVDLIKNYWIILVIIIGIIVVANLIYIFFVKVGRKREEKKTNETPKKDNLVEMTDEERKRYLDKIKFLEARVDELEDDIKVYEGEINEAKMSTLNLTQALREMQDGKPVEPQVIDQPNGAQSVKIVNGQSNVEQKAGADQVNSRSSNDGLPPQVVKLRDAVYTNVREVTERYRQITPETSQEEVNKIVSDFNKAKTQLAQYKDIEKKYTKKS